MTAEVMCVAAVRKEGTPSQSSRDVQASLAAAEGQIEALNQRVNRKNAQLAEAHTALLAARQDMQLHSQSSARSAGGSSEHGELGFNAEHCDAEHGELEYDSEHGYPEQVDAEHGELDLDLQALMPFLQAGWAGEEASSMHICFSM